MTTATAEKTGTTETAPQEAKTQGTVAKFQPPRLPYHPAIEARFGVKAAEWKALVEAVFPLAQSVDSVVLALSYCKARKLDPFKRVVHIVPIWDKNHVAPNGKKGRYIDTIWPGIGELRTTAFRTKQYAGADACQFGNMTDRTFSSENDGGERRNITVKFPEWAQLTVYRMIDGQRVPIPGPRVYWLETYSRMGRTELPNDMWQRRPVGQLEKCAEAAALRRAFPEELGDEAIDDEVGSVHIGPDNAKEVNPRPTRESVREQAAPEPPPEPFSIINGDGEEIIFDDPKYAAEALAALLQKAATSEALAGLWESNSLVDQLKQRDCADLAGRLNLLHTEMAARLQKPASAPSPMSLKGKAREEAWPAFEAWCLAEIGRLPRAEVAGFMDRHKAELDFIAENRGASWEKIEAAVDAKRDQPQE